MCLLSKQTGEKTGPPACRLGLGLLSQRTAGPDAGLRGYQ